MSVDIDLSEKRKPETIEFYNKTGCGVNIADQMACQYSVKAGTRRWPVAVFYNILYLACINTFVLYKERTENSISRLFIFKLATELKKDYLAEEKRSASEQESSRISKKSFNRKQCQVSANCKINLKITNKKIISKLRDEFFFSYL